MAKEKNEIIKEADTEIKKYTSSEEAIHLEIMQEMWESDRASELGDARRDGIRVGREEGREERRKTN